ncbi:uncharacterized protein LJ264_005481 [Porphyrio hochstetteri]
MASTSAPAKIYRTGVYGKSANCLNPAEPSSSTKRSFPIPSEFFFLIAKRRETRGAGAELPCSPAQKQDEASYPAHLTATGRGCSAPSPGLQHQESRRGGRERTARERNAGCQAARPRQRRAGGPRAHAGNARRRVDPRAGAAATQPPVGRGPSPAGGPGPGRAGERRGSAPSAAAGQGGAETSGPRRRTAGAGERPPDRTEPGGAAPPRRRDARRRVETAPRSAPRPPGRPREGCGSAARGAPTLLSRTHGLRGASRPGPALTGGGGSSSSAAGGKAKGEGARSPPRSAGRSRGPDGSGETGAKAGACRAGEGEGGTVRPGLGAGSVPAGAPGAARPVPAARGRGGAGRSRIPITAAGGSGRAHGGGRGGGGSAPSSHGRWRASARGPPRRGAAPRGRRPRSPPGSSLAEGSARRPSAQGRPPLRAAGRGPRPGSPGGGRLLRPSINTCRGREGWRGTPGKSWPGGTSRACFSSPVVPPRAGAQAAASRRLSELVVRLLARLGRPPTAPSSGAETLSYPAAEQGFPSGEGGGAPLGKAWKVTSEQKATSVTA